MIPLQQDCPADEPNKFALWAFVALPMASDAAPLVAPPQVMEKWSKHMWECGFRHHPELQEIKYQPPTQNHNWLSGTGGRWVDIDEKMPPEVTAPSLDHLTREEKSIVLKRLLEEIGDTLADQNYAGVVNDG